MRSRFEIRTLALGACVALALTSHALAGEPAAERNPFALEPFAPIALPGGGKEARDEDPERPRKPKRPVHPVAAAPDYGTAENAFGAARAGHVHAGQDVFAPAGTALVAVREAAVVETGSDGGQGNYVYLYDPRRRLTYVYMHMLRPAGVEAGERVRAGQRVGAVGCTGSCWGDHLHFEVHSGKGIGGKPRDPMPLLERAKRFRS